MVVDAGLTDKELTPVPPLTGVPPQLTSYQSVVYPIPGSVTEIVEDAPLHIVAGLAAIPVGAAVRPHVTFPLQLTVTSGAPPPAFKINSPL